MDIVYASLRRRSPGPVPPGEAAEVLAALWAHARPDDGLQHVSARSEDDRIDLLVYLLTRTAGPTGADAGPARARALIDRSHLASPLLRRRYLPPPPDPATGRTALS